jgi:hypothetical protein
LMPTLRALMVQATGMAEKLDPITLFDAVLGLLEVASGDIKKVVPVIPGLMNSIAKVMALTPLPFAPAGPAGPVAPAAPAGPVAPAGPWGIVKLRTAAELVPAFVTAANVPDAPVVVVPTVTVDEDPARARTTQIPPLPDTFVAGSTAVFVTSAM